MAHFHGRQQNTRVVAHWRLLSLYNNLFSEVPPTMAEYYYIADNEHFCARLHRDMAMAQAISCQRRYINPISGAARRALLHHRHYYNIYHP